MNDIEAKIKGVRATHVQHLMQSFDNYQEAMEPDDGVSKAEETDIEKSDILDAVSYSGNIQVSKSGKEIKEQVNNVIMPDLTAKLEEKKKEATEKLKECGTAPTNDVEPWWAGNTRIDIGFKRYNWDETYYPNDESVSNGFADEENIKKINFPESKEQSQARREYNEIVRCICEISADIKACDILKMIKDNATYNLTPRQVIALRF